MLNFGLQALVYYSKTVDYNQKDESAFLNRAITRVSIAV